MEAFLIGVVSALAGGFASTLGAHLIRQIAYSAAERQAEQEKKREEELLATHKAEWDRLLYRAQAAQSAGAKEAAIILGAAALEAFLRSSASERSRSLPLARLVQERAGSGALDKDIADTVTKLWKLRNETVHGMPTDISDKETAMYLHSVNDVIKSASGSAVAGQ